MTVTVAKVMALDLVDLTRLKLHLYMLELIIDRSWGGKDTKLLGISWGRETGANQDFCLNT